jgi:hypothetical protein
MLLALLTTALLCPLAVWGIVKAALGTMRRLGVDPTTALLWLGLAEWPVEHPPPEPQPLGRLLVDTPPSAPGLPRTG